MGPLLRGGSCPACSGEAQEPTDKDGRLKKDLQEKRFLQEFPQLERKLEEHIRKIQDLTDHLDKEHRDCTISNVVFSSTSIASGVLGLLLEPFRTGTSLTLAATLFELGAAAGVTSLTTTIVENTIQLNKAEARHLVGVSMSIVNEMQ
ncbi:apolipoprotein L3-like protein [Cricetulus griseus]|uniref:Apolipoprotein L3-like protein n=1 Tax=Cricetulus griseus TaxID=10029 RepID=A0A061IJ28_CRIGR|nr:apolipoprotein L3-like protein [Cricetulus griseus]